MATSKRTAWIDPGNPLIDVFDKLHPFVSGRRKALSCLAGLSLPGLLPSSAQAATQSSSFKGIGPWHAAILAQAQCAPWLRRRTCAGWEELRPEHSLYRERGQGRVITAGWSRLCDLLRDTRANRVEYMDLALLDILVCMQYWCWYYGARGPLIITSGFRTKATNDNLEGAARNSLHMQGRAVDLRHPEVDSLTLSRMGVILQMGGVGFYPSSNFTHLDTGNVRRWGQRAYARMQTPSVFRSARP